MRLRFTLLARTTSIPNVLLVKGKREVKHHYYILHIQSSGFLNRDFYPPEYKPRDQARDDIASSPEEDLKRPLPTVPLVTVSYEDGRTITLHPNVLEISYYVIQTRLYHLTLSFIIENKNHVKSLMCGINSEYDKILHLTN